MKTKIFNAVCKTRYLALLVVLIFTCGNAWGTNVTYSFDGDATPTTTGTAPAGSSAALSGTYTNIGGWMQCANNGSAVLTLTGYTGYKITGITIQVKSNKSSGTGSFSVVAGSTTIASITSSAFKTANWNGAWNNSSSGVSKTLTMSNDNYEIKTSENVVLSLNVTSSGKSLYIKSWAITYEAAGGGGCSTDPTASWSTAPSNGTVGGNMNATLTTNYAAGVVYSSSNTSVATVSGNGTTTCAITYVAAGSARITATVTGDGSTICEGPATCYTDITVSAPAVSHTVTWLRNGSNYVSPVSYDHGDPLEFPAGTPTAPSGSCSSKVFVGWTSDSEITSETSTAPSFISEGGAVNADVTYRAVFADALTTFSKVTNPSTLRAGDIIAIVSNNNNYGLRVSSNAPAASASTYADAASITPAADMLWTLAGNNTTGFTFTTGSRTTSGPETLGAASVPGNNSSTNVTLSASNNTWKFTSHNTSNCLLISPSSKSTCGLEYYRSAWKIYTKSSDIGSTAATAMRVYRKDYDNYITKCCTDWSVPTLTYSIPGGWKAGDADVNATISSGTTHGTVSFESSNPSVLTVNTSTGAIHAVGAGTATVTATWPGDATYCPKTCTSATITVSGNVTVVFDKNGGDGTMANQAVPYNTSTALNSNAYTAPSCKYFYGWADTKAEADAGTRDYTDGQNVTLTAGVTLYAVWKTIQYTVARGTGTATGCSGGTFTFSPSTVDCGGTVTITSSPDDNHKGSPTVTILPAGSGTVSGNTITGVSGNITSISVSYAEKVDVTATWNVNNGSVTGGGTTTQKEGSTFTFPNVTSTDCGTFLGWTNAANSSYSSTSGKPTPFYSVGSTIVLNANTQFYAVYSKVGDDAVAGTLYQYNNDGTDLDDDTHGVTPSKSVTNKNSAPWIGFESVGNYIIWDLGGTPTSFSAYLVSSTGGTGSGQSTMVLEQGDKDGGVYTWDATPIATRSTSSASTEISMNITDASKFEKSHLRLRMSEKRMNIRMGAVTINGLIATITYTTNPGCVDWVLDAINVTTAPTKTTYNECEEFDPAGMVVTGAYYENGNPSNTTTKDVAGYTWSPEQFLTPGNTIPVTITYTEKAVTKTTTTNVTVTNLDNYTITFHDGPNTTTWTQSNHCDACNLDSRTGSLACGDYTFAGWSTSSTSYDDENATITTWVSGSYTPTANTHLYAVYRKGATPPDFTLNCDGGTFYIYEANGNTHMAGRVNNTPRAYTSEYWNNDGGTGCVACLDDGPDLTPFTFTKIAENTYKIQNSAGEYLRKYSSGNHPDFESTWYNEDNFKWVISAGTNGTWRFTNKNATDYALVKSGSYFDFQLASNVTALSSYYDLELEPAASTVYQSNPNCASTYTITFNTHGGTFVQGNYAYATETTSGLSGTTTSKFPSATLSGCTFAGWKEGSVQEEVTSSNEGDAPILIAADANMSVSSNKTYHAVYHYYDEDLEFDPVNGGTYHMYATISGTKHFCSGTPGTSYGILTSTTDCNDVVDVVITPGTGANVGKYKINIGGYDVSPELNGTGLKRGTFWWNIAEVDDNLYHITADGAESGRSLNYYSTSSAFTHYKDNGAGNTKDISFGRCRQHHWTSEPVLVPMVVLNSNSNIMVTSTNGQTLRSTTMLTVTATHYGETTKIYLSANVAGVGFLKSDGTALSSDAGGSYLQTDAEGELATSVYVTYAPTVTTDGIENVTITARDGHSPSPLSQTTRSAQVRHLPTKFIIAQKVGDDWYALPNDMGNDYTSSTAAVKLSSVNESTGVATFYSEVTDQFAYQLLASKGLDKKGMVFSSPVKSNNIIKANTTSSTSTIGLYAQSGWTGANVQYYEFTPATTDLVDYTIKNTFQNNYLGITTGAWGIGSTNNVRFFSIDQQPAPTITWYNDMLDAEHATNKAENGVVSLPAGADPLCCVAGTAAGLSFDGWVTATWEGYRTTGFTKVNAGDAATTNKTYYAVFKTEDNKYFTKCPNTQTVTYSDGAGNTVVETYFVDGSGKQITCKDIGTGEGQVNLSKSGYVLIGWTTSANYGSAFKYVGNTVTLYPSSSEQAYKGDLVLTAVWVGELTITGDVHLTSTYTSAARSEANTVYTTANPNNLLTVSAAGVPASVASNLKIRVSYLTSADETQASSTCPFRLCNDGSSNYNIVDGSNLDITSGDYSQTYAIGYKPSMAGGASGTTETYKLKLELINSGGDKVFSTAIKEMYGRILPTKFVVAAKVGGAWRALPADIATGSGSAMDDAYPISVDADGAPTVATYAPKAALYSGTVRAHNAHQGGIRLTTATGDGSDGQLQATRSDNAYLWRTTSDCNTGMQEWYLVSSDFGNYEVRLDPTLKRSSSGSEDEGGDAIEYVTRQLCVNGNKILFGTTSAKTFRILPVTNEYEPVDLQVVEWKSDAIRFMYYGNPSYTASVEIDGVLKSAAPATLGTALKIDEGVYEIAVSDLMTSAYKPLYIIIKNGGTEIGRKQIYVPLMVNTTTTVATAATGYTKGTQCPQMDLIVLPGGKLTADDATAYEFKTITVYGGGKLIVEASKGITATSAMNLRAGSINVSSKGSTPSTSYIYTYPEVYLGASATLTVPGNKINFDYLTNYDQYFGLALPYPVTINATTDIFYPSDIYGAQAKRGSFMLRAFDSKIRANQGAVSAVWVDVESGSTGSGGSIAAQAATVRGLGYTFLGVPLKVSINGGSKIRQKYGIHRMRMDVTGASALATAENANAAIHVDTYSASQIFNTGWWLLGNPYMASLSDGDRVSGTSITVGTIGTNAEGEFEWKSKDVRYVTVPDDAGGDTYDQRRVVDYTFPAFKPFYVQVGTSGDVTFSYTSRNAAAPARFSDNGMPNEINVSVALNTAAYGDTTYLLIGDAFSEEYEIGDDMMKMPHANVSLFTVSSTYDLFANALNHQSAEAGVPVGYVAPSAGTYEFEHVETDESAWLEHLWLEDHETGTTVDLLDDSYEFEANAGTNKTRFVLFAVLKKTSETPTDIDGASEDKVDRPMKFIYRDKLYILRSGKIYDSTGKLVKKINK